MSTKIEGVVARPVVRDAVAAAIARMPKGSQSTVEGDDLLVAGGEAVALATAITEHMRAIVKENRSANMYREGELRQVRSALIAALPEASAGAARPAPTQKPQRAKAAERVSAYQASKKAAADAKAAKPEGQPEKVAEARRTRKAPSTGSPPVPASA